MLLLKVPRLNTTLLRLRDTTVCSCHVTYAFQSEYTLYICLNVKELLARSRRKIKKKKQIAGHSGE